VQVLLAVAIHMSSTSLMPMERKPALISPAVARARWVLPHRRAVEEDAAADLLAVGFVQVGVGGAV